jgi:signal transduction histidine kinase
LTRRIVPALLAFLAIVLTAAVIPLALHAASHDRSAFIAESTANAQSIASAAEERLADGMTDPGLQGVLDAAARQGDTVVVLNAAQRVIASRGTSARREWRQLAAAAARQDTPLTRVLGGAVLVAVSIRDAAGGPVVGAVLLCRPTTSLSSGIRSLWASLAWIAVAAMVAAALLAVAFARWVARPLAHLDTAALRLANGDLSVRPSAASGPPEVRRLAGSVAIMASRLDALVRGHRAMLADVSHQMRTPLAALRLRVDLVAADAADGKPGVAEELAGVQEEIARLSHLLDGLLAVARAEAVTESRQPVDITTVVTERVAAWQPVADERSVRMRVEAPEAAKVGLVPGHLEQVLDNLLDNALEAVTGRDEPEIVVRVRAGSAVRVEVSDNGPGMPEAERARAFGRFTTGSPGGTGIGLAIVQRLVTASGGTARLEPTPGGGLTARLEFPAA